MKCRSWRPLYLVALLVAAVGTRPGLAALAQGSRVGSAHPATASTQGAYRGVLLAFHRRTQTGDLALADGTLLPLRFATAAQEKGIGIGARLTITAVVQGHARLVVRALHVTGHGATARVHGIVARLVEPNGIEILGVHGATVIVLLPTRGGAPGAHAAGSSASKGGAPPRPIAPAPGTLIDVQVRVTLPATLLAIGITGTGHHAARLEVEGIITATNPAAGTIVLEDEGGQRTVVSVGAPAAAYYVGERAEVEGTPTGQGRSVAHLNAVSIDREDGGARRTQQGGHDRATATSATSATAVAERQSIPPASPEDRSGGTTSCYYTCPATATTVPATAQPGLPSTSGDDRHAGGGTGCYYTCPATATAVAVPATPSTSGDDGHPGGSTGCYYTCPATATAAPAVTTPTDVAADHHANGGTGCYYTCPATPAGTASAPPIPTAAADDGHSGGGTGCYYTCPATPAATTPPTPTAVADDHHAGGGTGCYYTCPATPAATASAPPTPTAAADDGHSGGGTGCYYTCPATPAATATAASAVTTPPTPTAVADDGHAGGGTGCYYTCPATPAATATVVPASATATTVAEIPSATATVLVQLPSATPTDDGNQRGKPTATATSAP